METQNSSSTTTTETHNPLAASEARALDQAQAAAASIPDDELIPIRVEVTGAAATVIGQMPAIESHRGELVAIFGDEAKETIDALLPAADALVEANARFNSSAERDLEPAAESLRKKRRQLLGATQVLVERGVAPKSLVEKQKGGNAYNAIHDDVLALATWLLTNQSSVASFCKLTTAELIETKNEAKRFLVALGEKGAAGSGEAATNRTRAFTHFARTYDRLRKLVTYVRWDVGDQDQIAPSLYAGRTRKGNEPLIAPPPAVPIAPGLPGSDPFIRNP